MAKNGKSYILGIQDAHNSSVCLLENGKAIYAIQEERLTNVKNYYGFPHKSVAAALKYAGLTPKDLDQVALASFHEAPAPSQGVVNRYTDEVSLRGKLAQIIFHTPIYTWYKGRRRKQRLGELEKAGLPMERVRQIEHHLCHASAVYYGMPTPKDEKVLVLTVDGSGDGLCATVSVAEGGEIKRLAATDKGHSLGNIYSRVTFMMGFVPWEHEYKLMGMAPYASERGLEQGAAVFSQYLDTDPDQPMQFKRLIPETTTQIYARLRRDTEFMRFDAICAGLQNLTEEVLVKWVRNCIGETGVHKLALSGGVFMNVKANQLIMQLDEVEQLYIMPSCGDETNSFGAAYRTYYETSGQLPTGFNELYLGDGIENDKVEKALEAERKKGVKFEAKKVKDMEKRVTKLLVEGEAVAICRGRMEFGARALGNRSILADPAKLGVVQEINMMIKKRDFWMPFAPVTTPDHIDDYMVNPKHVDSPYMMLSFDTNENHAALSAAIHQADHTARFQIVSQEQNPSYYAIIKEFEKLTGRGVLLNTSFNLHGYPIVYGPEEAMWVFTNSELQYLALGDYLVSKANSPKLQ